MDGVTYFDISVSYTCEMFLELVPVENGIKRFRCNYATISITSVNSLRKYASRSIDYTENSFTSLDLVGNVIKLFSM